jgi:O-antigen/teichoic acid export membrane protein
VFAAAEEERWALVAETRAAFTRVVAIGCGALAVLAPVALRVLLPGGYDTAELGATAAVTAFAVMPFLSRQTAMVVLMQRQRTGPLAWSTIPAVVISLGLCLALVPPLGLVGAALATVAGFAAQAAILRRLAGRLAVIPSRGRETAISWASAAALSAAAAIAPAGGAWLAARVVAGLALASWLTVTVTRLIR